MTIDTPTIDDLAALIVESKGMFDQMGFEESGNEWQFDSMVEWWQMVLMPAHHDITVAREGNRIVGVSVVNYRDRFLWHRGQLQAWEQAHHASPDLPTAQRCRIMIAMFQRQIEKVRERGATYLQMSYDPKFPAWGKYLMKHGFTPSAHCLSLKV